MTEGTSEDGTEHALILTNFSRFCTFLQRGQYYSQITDWRPAM